MAGYKKFIPEALRLIESRRAEAESKAQSVKDAIYRKEARLYEIDRELSKTMIDVSRAILAGGDYSEEIERIKDKNLLLAREKKDILARNNLTPEDIKPKYVCTACSDTGYKDGVICECLRTRAKFLLYNDMANGVIQKGKTFHSFDLSKYPDDGGAKSPRMRMKQAFEDAKDFAEKFDYRNLLFIGRTGLGKTHISLAIANELIDRGYNVIYTSAPSLFIRLEKERFSKDGNFSDLLEEVIDCDLLIIDDLGAEMKTQFTVSALYQIINERLNAKKPIIISSNLSIPEIDTNYEERIASRIFGNFDGYQFVGKDIRREFRN